ncbi:outer membrane protein assembly factor BamB family protein [Haloferax marisrubri]|uniref:outer membrane protein assembly factor BamB family protein n=1 Tax=Haloferax marisrubri TaxID=1544719 RepID=UPI001E2A8AC6|nr:PQQ-binding-like beta-propeller repeat protein [Haloferax marisrubri]
MSDTARHRYRLHSLSAATVEERWQVPLRSEPNGPSAVAGDHIVVTAKRGLEQARVVAFRKRYGEEDWLVDIDVRLTAAPTIDGGTVYVPDWSGRVHALSVWDGSVQWSQQVGAADGGRTFTEPVAVLGDTLYLGSQSGSTGNRGRAMDHESRWRQSCHRDSSGDFRSRIGGTVVALGET